MWPGLLPVSCLLVSLRMIPTFLWVSSSHNQQQQKTQPHREGSILIIRMSPPHLDPIRHTHLRGEGWTLACLAWYVITHCAQAVWSGEGHGKGSEYPMSSASQPPNYLRYWWWHLTLLWVSHQADHCSQNCLARSLRYDEPITYNTD